MTLMLHLGENEEGTFLTSVDRIRNFANQRSPDSYGKRMSQTVPAETEEL